MSGWRIVKISEVADVIGGGTPSSKRDDYYGGEVPWLTPKDLSGYNGKFIGRGERNITDEGLRNSSARLLPKDTVLITSRAPIGYVAIASNTLTTNQGFKSLVLKPGNDPHFFYYLIKSNVPRLEAVSSGSTFKEISGSVLKEVEFKIPDSDTQKAIVRVLNPFDEKIALNRKLNETLERMARALFQSWFVDFDPVKAKLAALRHGRKPDKACMAALSGKLRIPPGKPKPDTLDDQLPTAEALDEAIAALDSLPEAQQATLAQTAFHFPANFQESELGLIPEGWSSVALYDTAEFVNGAAFKSADFTDDEGALPIIKIAELKQGISEQTKFTKKGVKERHRISDGDLLYSWSGSPGTSLEVFKWFGGEGWLNQHIFKINTTTKEQGVFVWLILKHLKPELIRIAENKQTTGLGHVTVADMKRLYVAWPDQAALNAFGCMAIPIYEEHSSHILENNSLAELRDSLLPKLLAGELPVE